MQLIWNGPNTTRYLESIYQTPAIWLPSFFLRLLWGCSRETSFSTSRTVSHTTELWNRNSPTCPLPRRVSTRAPCPLGHRIPSSPAIFWGHRQTSRLHQVTFALPGSISSPTLWSITSNHSLATIFFLLPCRLYSSGPPSQTVPESPSSPPCCPRPSWARRSTPGHPFHEEGLPF